MKIVNTFGMVKLISPFTNVCILSGEIDLIHLWDDKGYFSSLKKMMENSVSVMFRSSSSSLLLCKSPKQPVLSKNPGEESLVWAHHSCTEILIICAYYMALCWWWHLPLFTEVSHWALRGGSKGWVTLCSANRHSCTSPILLTFCAGEGTSVNYKNLPPLYFF